MRAALIAWFAALLVAAPVGQAIAASRPSPLPSPSGGPADSLPWLALPAPANARERALRRRLVRMARLAMLERRAAQLAEFLANARAQSLLFEDDRVVDAGSGIVVGPATVRLDFLGSPIVRANVRNATKGRVWVVLTLRMHCMDANDASASAAVGALEPGHTRIVELLGPPHARPVSLTWSASNL